MSNSPITAPKSDRKPDPWWVVFETHNIGEAHIVAGRLRSEGIPTQIISYAGSAALGITVGVFGEVRLLVPAEQAERARAILSSVPELDHTQLIYPPGEGEDAG